MSYTRERHRRRTRALLTLVARALVHLERYQDASAAYAAAISADPTHIEAHLGGGELFTEKYNYAEASEFFADALRVNPHSARAHLGLAANKRLEGGAEVSAALGRALSVNPNLVGALALKAALDLEAGDYDVAAAEIDKALKVNPRSSEAHALRAALLYLQDRDPAPAVAAALAINARDGRVYDTLSHYAPSRAAPRGRRLLARAVELSRACGARTSVSAWRSCAGPDGGGPRRVETFEGDPLTCGPRTRSTCSTRMRDFRETRRGQFVIKADARDGCSPPTPPTCSTRPPRS